MKKTITRRFFLKSSAAAVAVPYFISRAQLLHAEAPSDRLRMGCIGLGGMGRGDAQEFTQFCDVVALCDVDSQYGLANALNDPNIGRKVDGQKVGLPDAYKDYRKVLDRKDIDVVSIVTTDPWHVKIAIEAMQAGKHVFCQKPLTLTVEEGILMRNAAKKYGDLVMQVGTQQRWQKREFATACLMIRKGMLGKIKRMVVDIGGGDTGGPFEKTTPPESLDFNMWLGQCPEVEYIPQRVHGNFRWWYEYSGGKFTDWGAHHIDFVHWALNETAEGCGPASFRPISVEHPVPFEKGYPTVDNCYNTSNRFEISCQFASGVEMVVTSHSPDGNGILVEGTEGRMHVSRGRIAGKPVQDGLQNQLTEDDFTALCNGKPFDGWHKQTLLWCIKDGGLPVSDVFSHIQTMQSCHLTAIAARLNRELKWDPVKEEIIGDEEASTFLARTPRKGYEIPVV